MVPEPARLSELVSLNSEARGIQSIEVGGRLLQALVNASQPMMLRDLAVLTDIAPAQAHAYLASYCRIELVEQDTATSRYRLGPFAMRLGMTRMRSDQVLQAASRAAAALGDRLHTTVAVVVWGCGAPTVIEIHEGPHELSMNMRHGTVFGVTNTFSGRVFAAFMDSELTRARIEEEFADAGRFGGGVKVTRAVFAESVADARRKGYAAGVDIAVPSRAAIAAPVLNATGQPLFVLTLIDATAELDVDEQGVAVQTLLATVREVGAVLSAKAPAGEGDVARRARSGRAA